MLLQNTVSKRAFAEMQGSFCLVLRHSCMVGNAQTQAVIPSRFYEESAFRSFAAREAFQKALRQK
jgi:hypothetical protein